MLVKVEKAQDVLTAVKCRYSTANAVAAVHITKIDMCLKFYEILKGGLSYGTLGYY